MNETERIAGGNKVMEVLFFKLSHKIIVVDTQRASPVTMETDFGNGLAKTHIGKIYETQMIITFFSKMKKIKEIINQLLERLTK